VKGKAALLDVTNKEATTWFVERLRQFQQKVGIDGFKFDAGTYYTYLDSLSSIYIIYRLIFLFPILNLY
jgi:1,4-alpha-glucan branching enzyme